MEQHGSCPSASLLVFDQPTTGCSGLSRASSATVTGTDPDPDQSNEAEFDLGDYVDISLWGGADDTRGEPALRPTLGDELPLNPTDDLAASLADSYFQHSYLYRQDVMRGGDMGVLDRMISNPNPTGQDNTWTLSSKGKVEGFHTTATVGWQNHFSGMGAPEEGPPSLCEKAKTPPVRSLALLGMTATSFQAHDAQLPTRPSRKSKPSSGIPRKLSEGIKKTTTTFVMRDGMSKFAVKVTRQPRTAEQRREAALTRKTGACIGCRLWRVPCKRSYGSPQICEQCLSRGSASSPHLCFILNITDCSVFRMGSPLHDKPLAEMIWITKVEVVLEVRMTGAIESRPMKVQCRHFRAADTDYIRKNVAGSVAGEFLEVPTYAAVNLHDLGHCVKGTEKYYRKFLLEAAKNTASGFRQQALWDVLSVASAHADRFSGSLVDLCLSLWTGTRLNQMERALVGDENLGMTPVDDHASPIHGLIPIPPILDNQIDRVTIIWMETLIQKVLKLLGSKISAKQSGNWFELLLAIMVLLVTAECTAKEQETFISEFATAEDTLKRKVAEWSWRLIEQLEWSSKRLAYTFKKIAKSPFPADATSLKSAIHSLGLQPEQAELMRTLLTLKGT